MNLYVEWARKYHIFLPIFLLLYLLIMDIATCYYRLYSFEEAFVFIVQDFPNAIFATTFSYN